ncbi:amino acid transporter LysE [Alcanivorax xiamenensis]|uniref:Amino acid transporter LysE n=1 Tax=Alcanivorax xiamenensis TaxID=1177156 RepID=A0ABQ6Y761_9GAMM|nr:LysE family translocator [Alcanivorax xiamenensis]KAF0804832.1 amino acid transporter LysE [Alcanivorax xiamenensis]
MEQFLMVAGAHFLALLSPGPDFLLILRSALVEGWRGAAGVCLGVALANGVFITLALAGFAVLRPGSPLFVAVLWAGAGYLFYLGVRLIRSAAPLSLSVEAQSVADIGGRLRGFAVGFASAILNPKNALFYASLFSLLAASGSALAIQMGYGLWMVAVVLGWDLLVAWLAAQPRWMKVFGCRLAWVERGAGAALILLAAAVAWEGWGGVS